jgi:cell wall assembly regulator SMI1
MQLLNELEDWLRDHLPEVAADLRSGATQDQLEKFSTALGIDVPDEFLNLYAWHNGQEMSVNTGPWYGLIFIPLDRVLSECEMWRKVLRESGAESLASLSGYMTSTPPDFVRKLYASDRWIPFAYDGGSNYLGIDLDPDEKGTVGQVISFGRDEERKIAVAPSISSFINWMLSELKSGNFNIRVEGDGGRSFSTSNPEKYHFLDSLALMFPAL